MSPFTLTFTISPIPDILPINLNMPVINLSNNTFITNSFNTSSNANILTVTYVISYKSGVTNVKNISGFSFVNSIGYFSNLVSGTTLEITSFGGIPLSVAGSQFANLGPNVLLVINPSVIPTIQANSTSVKPSLDHCFTGTKFNSNINNWPTFLVTDMSYMFLIDLSIIVTVSTEDYSFYEQSIYDQSNFNPYSIYNNGGTPLRLNTSGCTNMKYMFYGSAFNQLIDTSFSSASFNTSNVTDMSYMFAFSQFNNDSNSLNLITNNCQNMNALFANNAYFNQKIGASGIYWNTLNVTNMSCMFYNAINFNNNNQPILFNTNNVTDMSSMFYNAYIFNQNISGNTTLLINSTTSYYWDTSNITNMSSMFIGAAAYNNAGNALIINSSSNINMNSMFAQSGFNQRLILNTANITDMSYMFTNAHNFNNGSTTNDGLNSLLLKTDTCTSLLSMFNGASSFNQKLETSGGYWNTTNVTDMTNMFEVATSFNNGSITNDGLNPLLLNTNNVNNMFNMFNSASSFNQKLETSGGYWNTTNVTDMTNMFYQANLFNNGSITNDGLNPLLLNIDMCNSILSMFNGTSSFNQKLEITGGYWNTTNVTDMSYMFYQSTLFNNGSTTNNGLNPLLLNTNNVNNMSNMFNNASSFNKKLEISGGYWNTTNVTDMSYMFCQATLFNNGNTTNKAFNPFIFYTNNVTDISHMFYQAINFNQTLVTDINSWNTQYVNNMDYMFYGATLFNNGCVQLNLNITGLSQPALHMFDGAYTVSCDIPSEIPTDNNTNIEQIITNITTLLSNNNNVSIINKNLNFILNNTLTSNKTSLSNKSLNNRYTSGSGATPTTYSNKRAGINRASFQSANKRLGLKTKKIINI
jgi:hypothetical protein